MGFRTLEEHMGAWNALGLAMGLTLISLPFFLYILSFYTNQVQMSSTIIAHTTADPQLGLQPNPSSQVNTDDSLTYGDTLVAIFATIGLLPPCRSRSLDSLTLAFSPLFANAHCLCASPPCKYKSAWSPTPSDKQFQR